MQTKRGIQKIGIIRWIKVVTLIAVITLLNAKNKCKHPGMDPAAYAEPVKGSIEKNKSLESVSLANSGVSSRACGVRKQMKE
ncbi:MAG: hypothetical protein IJI30_01840 [Lachnospiraceae bacterium]|nr:hypothetical protein [Lachnospiraceae bacterium]